ncbi:MAG: tetratricopeptide repeat protein, partial [Bacteroidota bacterium]
YVKATEMLQEFILMSGAFQLNEYQLAHYTLGYAYFNQKKYTEAATWFRKYVAFEDNSNTKTVTDANIRIGDCLFVNIQYWPALEYYEKAANKGDYDVDYALFQQGFVYGLVQRPQKKIELMRRILSEHPESSYADDALFELGKAYTAQQNNTQAGQYYNELINSYPNSSYKKKSLVQLGLIYYNTDRNDQALEMYKSVVENYPGTPEAKDALLGIKNIYLDMNDVDRYFEYVKEQGNYVTISTAEQDSLTYKAAENLYMAGNCDRAVQQMTGYLEKYPQGVFTTNAWFYKGDCHYQNEQYEEALKAFNKVIEEPKNMFTEAALLGASRINFANEEYQVALENYTELEKVTELKGNLIEARLGQMRCHYLLAQYEKAIAAANELLLTEKISSEMEREARFQIATSYRKIGREDDALDEYRLVAQEVTSEEGAESKYWAAQLLFNKEELEKAEEVIFEFIDMNTPHQYWMARSFILLAKTYMEREDYFQAGHTLQSILDYYEIKDDGIIDEARQLKRTIEQLEGEENKSPELQDIEINIDEDSTNE